MKKTITKPDGTTETIEGSPEELAEFEKKLKSGELKEQRSKKRVLTDQRIVELLEQISQKIDLIQLFRDPNTFRVQPIPFEPYVPWIDPINPVYPPLPPLTPGPWYEPYRFTWTSSETKITG